MRVHLHACFCIFAPAFGHRTFEENMQSRTRWADFNIGRRQHGKDIGGDLVRFACCGVKAMVNVDTYDASVHDKHETDPGIEIFILCRYRCFAVRPCFGIGGGGSFSAAGTVWDFVILAAFGVGLQPPAYPLLQCCQFFWKCHPLITSQSEL